MFYYVTSPALLMFLSLGYYIDTNKNKLWTYSLDFQSNTNWHTLEIFGEVNKMIIDRVNYNEVYIKSVQLRNTLEPALYWSVVKKCKNSDKSEEKESFTFDR